MTSDGERRANLAPRADWFLIGLEPSPRLLAMARRVKRTGVGPVEFIEGSAEAIPLNNASIDTVTRSM